MPYQVQHEGITFRWLPKDPAIVWKYHHHLLSDLREDGIYSRDGDIDEKQLSLVILEFKQLIEEDAEIFRDFHEMFKQAAKNRELAKEQGGLQDDDQLTIDNYMQLLAVLNKTITVAPSFQGMNSLTTGVVMYAVLAPYCNTEAGYRAFVNEKVNAMFHKVFDVWSRFLVSPASRNVLVTTEGGWFSPEALEAQVLHQGVPFDQLWVCDKNMPHWGFTSWDDYFVRRFQPGQRDTVDPYNKKIINVACEALTYRVATGVQATDHFWIKDQPYSLEHVLNYDPLASQLENGTVFQAVLSSMDYHRWHSPIDGRVVKTEVVPGTYFAARVDNIHNDLDVITRSQSFVTTMCARALIFIESDNPNIGLMCFVGVGLVEVSTTKIEVRPGDRIKKGDELGSFHFGGSTHLLIFRPEAKLRLTDEPTDPKTGKQVVRKVGTVLFYVDN